LPAFFFLKREEKIYILLNELASSLCEASLLSRKSTADSALPDYHLNLLQAVKKRGDRAANLVWKETSRQFVLPFDPEDITALARQMNKVLFMIVLIAENISSYQISAGQEKELSGMIIILDSMVREIYQLIASLPDLKSRRRQIGNKCEAIRAYREQGQLLYLKGTGGLYRQENLKAGDMLMRQQVYMTAERALDSCYDLSYTIREMTIKYV